MRRTLRAISPLFRTSLSLLAGAVVRRHRRDPGVDELATPRVRERSPEQRHHGAHLLGVESEVEDRRVRAAGHDVELEAAGAGTGAARALAHAEAELIHVVVTEEEL